MKILIADDDVTIHTAYSKFLSKDGYEVLHAYDGEEALKQAREELPEIILLDIMMPKMDGRDVCKKIKESPATSGITVIMLTSRDQEWDRTLGLELGVEEYVTKPCDLIYLGTLLNRVVRKIKDQKGS